MFVVCYVTGLKNLVHVRVVHHTCTKQSFEGHKISCTKTFVRITSGYLILIVILASWKKIGCNRKKALWYILFLIILDYLSLNGNELTCFYNKQASIKVRNIKHDFWKQSYEVHIYCDAHMHQKSQQDIQRLYAWEFQILSALCNILVIFIIK